MKMDESAPFSRGSLSGNKQPISGIERAKYGIDHRMVDDVSIRMCDASQLEIWGVALGAVEPDTSDHDGLAGLVSRIEAVDVVPVAYLSKGSLPACSRVALLPLFGLEVGARAGYQDCRAALPAHGVAAAASCARQLLHSVSCVVVGVTEC